MHQSELELHLCGLLKDFPHEYKNRYDGWVAKALIETLFRSLAGYRDDYLQLLFPQGPHYHTDGIRWSLRASQGAEDGAEYTEAARGHPCGHIFKAGESTYRCKTCSDDDTAVLCAKCFQASDHEDHAVYISVSGGNSGCCDCGDDEAWKQPCNCMIHTIQPGSDRRESTGDHTASSPLPADLQQSIRTTISRVLDYFCDVWSCSPEQLRLPKTVENIKEDEERSRLNSTWYGESDRPATEYALVLWNDEKHTVYDVQDVVARACRVAKSEGMKRAGEVDEVGRTIIKYSSDIQELLNMAKIIEQPKLTVTIRSVRDTFRESMCETIIEWLLDIAGCSVGPDPSILRSIICEELVASWRIGSSGYHRNIGEDGLDDHEGEEMLAHTFFSLQAPGATRIIIRNQTARAAAAVETATEEESDETDVVGDEDVDMVDAEDELGDDENLLTAQLQGLRDEAENLQGQIVAAVEAQRAPIDAVMEELPMAVVPQTPYRHANVLENQSPNAYWCERPAKYKKQPDIEPCQDLWQRIRLDYMILWDMRMWKKIRADIRDLFIGTVVTAPSFKRILGLRFAGVYTVLAELYLIADREPDHSIINLSLQMLTTPSITAEVVERGNFFTNLMAILYTFLTTRQVGYPANVDLRASLEFEQGAVGNRRIYQFYQDMSHLLGSEHVQECLRTEPRYLKQFLDIVKLHQGICPNVRQVGEHLEYEADQWVQARIITDEIMKLSRKCADAFTLRSADDVKYLTFALQTVIMVMLPNVLGTELTRFHQSELKRFTSWKSLDLSEYGSHEPKPTMQFWVVDYEVAREPMSFHHALHHSLSWLLDKAKQLPIDMVRKVFLPPSPENENNDDLGKTILALFDFPVRVCAWLAQMKAGMWVRNGVTLRHQMQTHKNVQKNNIAYHRDLFLLQAAFVICEPAQVLAQMVDRYDIADWAKGDFKLRELYDEQQKLDIAEDFVHLLIVMLTDRTHLRSPADEPNEALRVSRRDVIHALCFKPLSFSELSNKVSERVGNKEEFADLLREVANFKAPEGLSDSGLFSLKDEFFSEIDPYLAWFSRNQREEAETVYKKHLGKLNNVDPAVIVYEPKLLPMTSGMFKGLSAFVRTELFAQIIFNFLRFATAFDLYMPKLAASKVEQYLSFVVHLVLVAVIVDETEFEDTAPAQASFCMTALSKKWIGDSADLNTIAGVLQALSTKDEFKTSELKIRSILRRLRQNSPEAYAAWSATSQFPVDRFGASSPAPALLQEKELKKKQAMERQARVLAQMKAQQNQFVENQIDWGDDLDSDEDDGDGIATPQSDETRVWKYPSGTCILCQEETDSDKLYGSFALVNNSNVFRQTDFQADDWLSEVLNTPDELDQSAERIRPFGVARQNRHIVHKVSGSGKQQTVEHSNLGKGYPKDKVRHGPVATGCGHMMHFSCFEIYLNATQRRHQNQVTRQHPERTELKEFLCPLCKALGNAFLPIIWKGKPIDYPGQLQPEVDFDQFLEAVVPLHMGNFTSDDSFPVKDVTDTMFAWFQDFTQKEVMTSIAEDLKQMSIYGVAARANRAEGSSSRMAEGGSSRMASLMTLARSSLAGVTTAPTDVFMPAFENAMIDSESTTPVMPEIGVAVIETVKAYRRLRDTVKVNTPSLALMKPQKEHADELVLTETMMKTMGHSLAAVEIAHRGVQTAGNTLIDSISNQIMTHLRVLCQSVTTYLAMGGLRGGGASAAAEEIREVLNRQFSMLFYGHPLLPSWQSTGTSMPNLPDVPPLLAQDSFILLAELSCCLVPILKLDIHHIIRLCYLAEMVRVCHCFVYDRQSGGIQQSNADLSAREIDLTNATPVSDAFVAFFQTVVPNWQLYWPENVRPRNFALLQKLLDTYALTFLRKTALLMHAKYGVDFASAPALATEDFNTDKNASELYRLTSLLNLPTPVQLFEQTSRSPFLLRCTEGWLYQYSTDAQRPDRTYTLTSPLTVPHPAIYELIALPELYSTLQEEANKRKCPTNGKELSDPALCLFCGEIFCSQAVCCMSEGGKGGCWVHRQSCGHNIGIFLHIRKCMIFLANGPVILPPSSSTTEPPPPITRPKTATNGSWFFAPYLDKFGEVDMALRRHQQLYLNQKRYDALVRLVWLRGEVPSMIARRLEGDSNTGGWETI